MLHHRVSECLGLALVTTTGDRQDGAGVRMLMSDVGLIVVPISGK